MKKYLILLLLIPCFCWGQKDTSYAIMGAPLSSERGVATFINGFGSKQWPERDTVKVLMLVCDTANYPTNSMIYFRSQDQMLNEGRMAWWQFGYEVWGSVTSDYTLLNVDRYGNIEPTMFLDENKKPLPKSIIVWMSKEIK